MFFIRTHNKSCGVVANVKCSKCGNITSFVKFRRKTTGYFLFIPFVSATKFAFVQCQECGAAYDVSKKSLKNMETAQQLVDEVNDFYRKKK